MGKKIVTRCRYCNQPIYNHKQAFCGDECRRREDIRRINENWVNAKPMKPRRLTGKNFGSMYYQNHTEHIGELDD